jgi:hypothetical protein
MIKTITAGTGIVVSGMYTNIPYISPGSTGAGMVRWNSNMQCFEINDGSIWLQMAMAMPTIELTQEVQSVITWARQKMVEDARLSGLIDQHPGIRDLKEKLDIMVALVNKENQTT